MQKINGLVAQKLAQRKYWLVVVQSQSLLGGKLELLGEKLPPASPTG